MAPSPTATEVVGRLRSAFERGVTKPYAWRMAQLDGLSRMLREQEQRFEAALQADLGRPPTESILTEIGLLHQELRYIGRHLRRWLRPVPAPVPLLVGPGRAATVLEPLGVALVIAPWNYPLLLTVSPLIGALAAGNAVVVKPSDLAPTTSALLAELLPRFLDARAVAVIEGGREETTELLEHRFDSIFYTGNGRVGRIVMAAAANHLTPVTLELGGKSPVYVDESADLDVAARRIAWAKFLNAGQTCVAPDHLLATPEVARELVPRIRAAVEAMWGTDPIRNQQYCRMVNERHFDRVARLLDDGTPVLGGQRDRGTLRIAPTVLTGIRGDEPVMSEEIFGPVLPIVEVADERAAIARVAAGDKPLCVYVFSRRKTSRRSWLRGTSSGAVGFGAPLLHLDVPGIPLGGVGASGTGSYHGRRSVLAFSHEKAVFTKAPRPDTVRLLQPPYGGPRDALLRRLAPRRGTPKGGA